MKEDSKNSKEISVTEGRNEKSMFLHQMSALEIATLMNEEELNVQRAVKKALPVIAEVAQIIAHTLAQEGRLFYFGAGTSGRLGVLDASECPPTFGVAAEIVQGVIAGGDSALRHSIEGAEDDPEAGVTDVLVYGVTNRDFVLGLAASGNTPYVGGVLGKAKELQAKTALICCNPKGALIPLADYPIVLEVGPEVLTGSSRLKAGTAQKQVLNMLSTIAFTLNGKVYSNLMIDVQLSNQKLLDRGVRILQDASGCDAERAKEALENSAYNVRAALKTLLAKE